MKDILEERRAQICAEYLCQSIDALTSYTMLYTFSNGSKKRVHDIEYSLND